MQVKQKMTFESETDTEVIPKLCMYVYNNLTEPLAFSEVGLPFFDWSCMNFCANPHQLLQMEINCNIAH